MIDVKGEHWTALRIAAANGVRYRTVADLVALHQIRPAFCLNDVAYFDADGRRSIESLLPARPAAPVVNRGRRRRARGPAGRPAGVWARQ